MSDPVSSAQTLVNETIVSNGRGAITGPVLNAALNAVLTAVQALGVGQLLTSQYKQALNAFQPGATDAMFQAVVAGNEGDPTRIAWNSTYAPQGGLFETLVSQWLQLPTTASDPGPGLGLSLAQAVAQIALLRANAVTQSG